MKISLAIEEEEMLERLMATGRFKSRTAVMKAALTLLEEESHDDFLRGEIEKGLGNLDRGEFKTYDDTSLTVLSDEIKARGRKSLGRAGKNPR